MNLPARIGSRIDVVRAGMIEVLPDISLKRSDGGSRFKVFLNRFDRLATQVIVSLDHREHVPRDSIGQRPSIVSSVTTPPLPEEIFLFPASGTAGGDAKAQSYFACRIVTR